jgi:hypothetical protein
LKIGTLRFAGFLNKGKLMLGTMIDGWTKPGMRAFNAASKAQVTVSNWHFLDQYAKDI